MNTDNPDRDLDAVRAALILAWLAALHGARVKMRPRTAGGKSPLGADEAAVVVGALAAELGDAVEAAMTRAYQAGVNLWGVSPGRAAVSDGMLDLIASQRAFALRAAIDEATGRTATAGAMGAARRMAIYSRVIGSAYHRGALDAAPPGTLIYWRLGACRHCSDCPILAAASPFTRSTMTVTPGSGATACGGRCRCYLDFVPGTSTSESAMPADIRGEASGTLRVPQGLRLPTSAESAVVRDYRARATHATRMLATASGAAEKRWLAARRVATAEMNAYAKARDIWLSPPIGRGDVLRGEDVRFADVDMLTRRDAIDGATYLLVGAVVVDRIVKMVADRARERTADVPGSSPNADEIARLAETSRIHRGDIAEAAAPRTYAVPVHRRVMLGIGSGLAATYLALLLALRFVRAKRIADVWIGPLGAEWDSLLEVAGVWLRGDSASVDAVTRGVDEILANAGMEPVGWTEWVA